MRGNKWSTQVLVDTKDYTSESLRPSVYGLSKHLGVSRQCMYNWAETHDEFRKAINEMRVVGIGKIHNGLVDVVDVPMGETNVPEPSKPKLEPEPSKPEVFVDELGDDEDWEFDD